MSLPVDKAIRKAQSLIKAGELAEAEELYTQVLAKFPKNKKAILGYQKLKAGITSEGASSSEPSQDQAQELINLYSKGQFLKALEKAKPLISLFPKAIILHNIRGASNTALQRYDAAIDSYKQAIKIKPDYADAYSNMGIALKDKGELDAAIDSYKQAIKIKPDYAVAYNNMGVVLKDKGELDAAIDSFKQAIKIKSDYADAYSNMGIALKDKGELDAAIDSYKQAIKIKPGYADAYYNMGNVLKDKGELDVAIDSYKKAIKIKPGYADAYYNMGNVLKDKGELDVAIDSYKQAIKIKPDYAVAYSNMGLALQEKGEVDEAIEIYKQALKIKSDHADAYSNMGLALQDKGEIDEAIESYEQAIKIKPDHAVASNNMGNALKDKSELDAAIDSYKQAIKIKPDYAEAYSNMGVALKEEGELDAAIDSYKQALKIKPDYAEVHHNLGFVLLNNGRLKEGLEENEWRWKTLGFLAQKRDFSQPLWDGNASLKGQRILIWGEQGPGDVVMWSYCLPFVASQAEHCILECPEKLVPLLARSFPNIEVRTENRALDAERADFDIHQPIGSLYKHFIPEISKNTEPNAFLVPAPVRVNFWQERLSLLGKRPFVGISWKSPFVTPKRLPNYTQIFDWAPVLALPDVTFLNLQSSNFEDDLVEIQAEFGVTVHNFEDLDHYDHLDDVAALCAALDIVVSVSTAVSTLAAGVGTPTKMLHWRQSPWNNVLFTPPGPSVDVFERNTWEPWDNVFQSVAKDIADFQVA